MSERYLDELEVMSLEAREKYQRDELGRALRRAYEHSATGREIFDQAGLKPGDISVPGDMARVPITRKNDIIELEKRRPYAGFLTVPLDKVDRIFVTPGPIYEPLHTESISWFARAFRAAGFGRGDVAVVTFSYHLSPGGLLFHEALRECGVTVIPAGVGNTEILIRTMLDLKVTGFAGTPSYLLGVIKKAEEAGHDWRRDFALRRAWFTGEMLTPSIRQTLESEYGLDTYQTYAVSEVGGALAYECSAKQGLHLMEEYLMEIVDPVTGMPLPYGETGEVVVTPLANPTWGLFRFGTGDLSALTAEPCTCGRTGLRMTGIVGRVGDAVKVRGMFVVGRQVETLLAGISGVGRGQVTVTRPGQRDELALKIELKDVGIEREVLRERVAARFQQLCLLRPDEIEFVPEGALPQEAKTITDLRQWR